MVLMLMICLTTGYSDIHGVFPHWELNEDKADKENIPMVYPYDVVMFAGKLHIADYSFHLLVFDGETFVGTIGRKGGGPGEFANAPVSLQVEGDRLWVAEMYGWARNAFSKDGRHIERIKTNPQERRIGEKTYKVYLPDQAMQVGARVQLNQEKVNIGKIHGDDSLDYHFADWVISTGDNILVLAQKRGALEVYALNGEHLYDRELDTKTFFREPEYHKMFTEVGKVFERTNMRRYVFGNPLFNIAVQDRDRIWILVTNEHLETDLDRRKEVWIGRFRISENRIDLGVKLNLPVEKIRISGGSLWLIHRENLIVRGYDLDQLDEVENKAW